MLLKLGNAIVQCHCVVVKHNNIVGELLESQIDVEGWNKADHNATCNNNLEKRDVVLEMVRLLLVHSNCIWKAK